MPKTYTAEAYIREGLATKAVPDASGGALIPVDASVLVETRARLLQSRQLAGEVVERLGLERIRPAVGRRSVCIMVVVDVLRRYHQGPRIRGRHGSRESVAWLIGHDRTAGVWNCGPLLSWGSRACSPRNECLRGGVSGSYQAANLVPTAGLAKRALSETLATFGEKHPKVMEAKERLEAADALLREQLEKTTAEAICRATEDGNVSLARVVSVPSSPKPLVCIGVALLIGVVGGVLIAAFRPLPRKTK